MFRHGIVLALFCLPFVLVCSCTSFKDSDLQAWEQKNKLVPLDTAAINGTYFNAETEPRTNMLLWDLILRDNISRATDVVDVRVVAPDRIQFSLVRWGVVIATQRLKFETHPTHIRFSQSKAGGYPPLLWVIGSFESGLGLTSENAVSVIHLRSGLGFVLIMPVGGAGFINDAIYHHVP